MLARSRRDVFPVVVASDLVALRQCSQGIRYGHLARLIALEPHLFEDLPAGEAVAVLDDEQELLALAAAPGSGDAPRSGLPSRCRLASLGRFVRFDGAEFAVDGVELLFKLMLLVEDSLALFVEALTLAGGERLEGLCHPFPPALIGGLVGGLPTFV